MMKNKKTILMLLFLIVILTIIGIIIARYRSKANSSEEVDIAFYVFESGTISEKLSLDSMVPRIEPYNYTLKVSNNQNGKVSETAIEYTIQIKATTNLPLNYSLVDEEGNNIFEKKNEDGIITEDDVYYIERISPVKELGLQKEEHVYTLSISFPEEYKVNTEYADVIELVEITVDSKQKI